MADLELSGPIDPGADIAPQDTLRLKRALTRLGFYRAPEGGLTDIPDTAMFEALETFQDFADLDERGSMVPNGPTARRIGELLSSIDERATGKGSAEQRPNSEKDARCKPGLQPIEESICVPGTSLCWTRARCVEVRPEGGIRG